MSTSNALASWRPWNRSAPERYLWRQRQRAARAARAAGVATPPRLEILAHPENLIRVYQRLRREAGKAPGVDGRTYDDLGPSEVAQILRTLSRSILVGRYRPHPCRRVQIPKAGGKGHRTLRIRVICDRVVAAALHGELTPVWEQIFLPGSFGFRPGRGVWDMLAMMEVIMTNQDRWVVAVDDIKNAFDNVRLDHLMDDHRRHVEDADLLNFIETVLRGHEGQRRREGIDQGGAYSPTALNVRLHHAHDLGLAQEPTSPPWHRYADNLVYLCRDVTAGQQALEQARQLLRPTGLTLKGQDGPPVDLRQGGTVQVLGFGIKRSRPRLELGQEALDKLQQDLRKAHEAEDPPKTAQQALHGWISSYGPAYESVTDDTPEQLLSLASQMGHREISSPGEIRQRWNRSWTRWTQCRARAARPAAEPPRIPLVTAGTPSPTVEPGV